MKRFKKIMVALLVIFIAIQFIQPKRNKATVAQPMDIAAVYKLPDSIQNLLKIACYDCHSNNTNYPWYANLQPAGWLLASHINNGKTELNFNEFGLYPQRRQLSKLRAIENSIRDGTMPLPSYLWLHKQARLSAVGRTDIISWVREITDSLILK